MLDLLANRLRLWQWLNLEKQTRFVETHVPEPIYLPSRFDGAAISDLADAVVAQQTDIGIWPAEILFDFSRISFVRPAGMVFLSNLIHFLHRHSTNVSLRNIDRPTAALAFMDDSLFFQQHCGKVVRPHARPRSTTQPLQQIAQSRSHDWLRNTLTPWLASQAGLTAPSLHPFQNCLAELFINIQDHTLFDIGTIFAQHFPRENRVYVTLSDMGYGIPAKVRERIAGLSDIDAVLKATEEGFTTKSTPRNRGIGLDYLLKAVVGTNGGSVTFYTGTAKIRFERAADNTITHQSWVIGSCPGTTIDIVLRTDRIEVIPDAPEDLEW